MVVSHRCQHGAAVCDHWVATRVRRRLRGREAINLVTIDLTGLNPGRYRLAATAIAPSGVSGAAQHLGFRLSRP